VCNLPEEVKSVSRGNTVRILDTPHLWGDAYGTIQYNRDIGRAATQLKDAVASMIRGGTKVVDIMSLNEPTGMFKEGISEALRELIATKNGEVAIRFTFGIVPGVSRIGKYRDYLLSEVIRPLGDCPAPMLVFGQLWSLKPKPYWNHCKIVAADGQQAIVGGHNLWDLSYASYPPAHDLSIEVTGLAAFHAQRFIDFLWSAHSSRDIFETWALREGLSCGDTTFYANASYPAEGLTPRLVPPQDGKTGGRIMALGRSISKVRSINADASDVVKLTLIENATKSIKVSQQDLVFSHFSDDEQLVCQAIARKLLSSPDFVAQVVVSPPQAWAGPQYFTAGGASYSWGDGALGTMRKIVQFINEYAKDAKSAHAAYDRLFVAPFCFTGVGFDVEEDYVWPGLGKIADPYPTGINTYPSPANHAKFYMADDAICYVGSDNLYPNLNTEFGYLIEAGDDGAFDDLRKNYWNQVWTYSEPNCVKPSKDFYIRVTYGSNDTFGWLSWDNQGYTILANTGEEDPSKINQRNVYRFQRVSKDQYLRAPAYGPHYSGSLGGYGTDGKGVTWWRGETSGYKVKLEGELLIDEFGRFMSMQDGNLVWSKTVIDGTCRLELFPFLDKT
jgi:phosphatidylserine/phosphatidylglycerophosphate/cardiolipin synthase-like enzyme